MLIKLTSKSEYGNGNFFSNHQPSNQLKEKDTKTLDLMWFKDF